MKQKKLGTKLVAGGLLALAIPLIVVGSVAVYESSRNISKMGRADMVNIAESLAAALDIGMSEQIVTVRNIAYSDTVVDAAGKMAKDGEKNAQDEVLLAQRKLTKIKAAEGDRLSSITLVGRNGIIYASSDSGKFKGVDLSGRDYLDKAFKGIPNVGSVVFSRATGRVICTAACPIYDSEGKEITGSVVIAMEFKFFSDILDRVRIGKTGYAFIVDHKGLYVHHPMKDNILKVNISEEKGMEAMAKLITEDKRGVVEYEWDGIRKVGAVATVPTTDWHVIASIPAEELYAPARFTRNVIASIALIFLFLASVLFYFFARKLTLPLVNVAEAAQRIADGDLTVEVAPESRQDEIGSLSRAFVLMIHSLKERAQAAERIAAGDLTVKVAPLSGADTLGNAFSSMVEKLQTQIKGIREGFNILSTSASEILASTSQVVSSTAETSAAISETTTTVEEVRQAAQLSSDKAQNVVASARLVSQASQTGWKAVEDTAAGMRNIRNQMDSIARTVVSLSEQSQSIGGIIASVTDLADQSNLLAVNAAIEAAKAGEQGKGFAVVAQEIRNLAEQSRQATAQVRDILSDIQKATGAAVMATEQGGKAVDAGMRQSEQAGEAIEALAKSSENAVQTATQIVASSQQQIVGMDQIGLAMENINQAGVQTASSIRQSETAARNLHELGQKLKQMVEQYKV